MVYVYCVIIRKLLFYEYRPEDWENAEVVFDDDGNVISSTIDDDKLMSGDVIADRNSTKHLQSERPKLASIEDISADSNLSPEERQFSESLKLYNILFTQATADLFASWEKPM